MGLQCIGQVPPHSLSWYLSMGPLRSLSVTQKQLNWYPFGKDPFKGRDPTRFSLDSGTLWEGRRDRSTTKRTLRNIPRRPGRRSTSLRLRIQGNREEFYLRNPPLFSLVFCRSLLFNKTHYVLHGFSDLGTKVCHSEGRSTILSTVVSQTEIRLRSKY